MTETEPTAESHDFTVTRVFDAPVERVWEAWTDPELVKQWWGPDGFSAPVCKMDFREQGTTLVSMKSPHFGEIFNTWTYRRIEPKGRIEFAMRFSDAEGRHVAPIAPGIPEEVPHVVTFKDLGDGRTEMSITETGYMTAEAAEMSKAGQEQVVEKMARVIS
jgi:uncharacterized protein YndB with AHSA1/START domain